MKTIFSTKAGTLKKLSGKLNLAKIPNLSFFTLAEWKSNRRSCLAKSLKLASKGSLAIRSSCSREDCTQFSNAGAFLSLINVKKTQIEEAIEKVIASYGTISTPKDEVLVQEMVQNVVLSGVAFSHAPDTCAPYRVINYSESSDTTIITSGQNGQLWRQAKLSEVPPPPHLKPVLQLLDELENIVGDTPIDCEFAISRKGKKEQLWLLQARPLIIKKPIETPQRQFDRLEMIEQKIGEGMSPHPFLLGKKTVYGVMPDWNPAEIIGIRPRPLSLSLYRELVTDSVWAYQRHNYGYRNLRSFPLMVHFCGLPYMDARLSFNSFIPASLGEDIASRLVDYYVDRLQEKPSLHDKVEFEIVFSSYTLDLPQKLKKLSDAGFSKTEQRKISRSLQELTNRILHPEDGLWRQDVEKLDTLQQRHETLLSSNTNTLNKIYWLIEDAKRYGTLPFAGLARAGFVAVQMLKSLVSVGIFSMEDYDRFLASVPTISSQLNQDRATLDKAGFLSRYGHLRPGTYDILSPRYDHSPELYFEWNKKAGKHPKAEQFSLTLVQMRKLAKVLEKHGLHPDPVDFFDFIESGIKMRELAKFHFTRNLSDAIELMVGFSEQLGISREDLSFADFSVFRELYVAAANPKETLIRSIDAGKAQYTETQATSLPPLIRSPEEVWGFHAPNSSPNFITQKCVVGETAKPDETNLDGKIVCINNADPGYDWLFARPIAGFVTEWGGANSHMAIRAGELQIPAVIGAGEKLFNRVLSAKRIRLDCSSEMIENLP